MRDKKKMKSRPFKKREGKISFGYGSRGNPRGNTHRRWHHTAKGGDRWKLRAYTTSWLHLNLDPANHS